ncbi:F-box protein At5g07610-like [Cucurbita maxima]|uniref:F-box protein At5g07610-like n=1 Tax=Cucurbita maxima TaxID=3661 RepID=A0A6J1K8B9_CUCMA|nr:F-box protein At5g07610-like [Cucurbita maxima]
MLRRKPPKIITRSTIAAAVKSLVANDDLLLEIFLRLPIRSLLRFKSVSKRWLSLISDPNFCHRRSAFQPLTPPSVILFRPYCSRFSSGSDLDYMDPNAPRVPYRSLEPTISECRIVILQSCNGLFLGRSYEKNVYYVYNPTTKQYKMLPMLKIIKNRVTLKSFAFELWIPQTTKSRFAPLILGSGGSAARVHS